MLKSACNFISHYMRINFKNEENSNRDFERIKVLLNYGDNIKERLV